MTMVGTTSFRVNKETGPERGGACPRPQCCPPRDCSSAGPAVPSTGSIAVDAGPLQGWLQGLRCSGPGRRGLRGHRKMEAEQGPRGEEIKKKSQSQRELEMAN